MHKQFPKTKPWRSEKHRRNVAALGCLVTGQPAQACHVNFNKGFALKVCDSLCFPLSPSLHQLHDQGGMPRQQRWQLEREYMDTTRLRLIQRGQWTDEIEQHYQTAIAPLKRVTSGDGSPKTNPATAVTVPGLQSHLT